MTYEEILKRFKNKFPSAIVSDFRPICHEEFTDGKQGITIWLDNGDIIEYYPQEKEDMISVYEKIGGELLREICRMLEERKESEEK